MNAAAALVVSGVAENFLAGAQLANRAVSSGAALEKLQQLIRFTNACKQQPSSPDR
jgi:anthranilate phosphoribosyltransferase